MKKALAAAAALAVGTAWAHPPVVIVQPAPRPAVVSPLTNSTSSSNQAVMNQITGTLNQRRFEHQLSTTQAALRTKAINAIQNRSIQDIDD